MDLKAMETAPSDAEREAVDALLGPPETSWEGGLVRTDVDGHAARGGLAQASARRRHLLPALQAVQARMGWISPGALGYLCRRLEVPPAEGYGVASFYALFSLESRPPVVAHVCDDIACLVGGAAHLCAALEETLGPEGGGEGKGNGKAPPGEGSARSTWSRSPCLGLCDRAPAALVVGAGPEARQEVLAPTSPEEVAATCARVADAVGGGDHRDNGAGPRAVPPPIAEVPQAGAEGLRLLARAGRYDPGSVDDYRSRGGYQALRRAVTIGPEGVLAELAESNLLGRGGAAFPIGRKWDSVARAPDRPHYLVCNADESEPGTFKDRILMEADPFAVVEAMTIAGYVTDAQVGYCYVRGEYPGAARALEVAIAKARARGLLGTDVMGEGFSFDIEVRRGAGAYICGEETALFNSIEGYRGEPRNKPPFPTKAGLFGRPTVVNNVETLVNVLEILTLGGAAYAGIGTPRSTGTRLFCLSGSLARPGLYEVAHGTTLGEVLDLAGGVPPPRRLQGILLGGAAGTFVGPDALDLPLSFEDTRAAGATLGSGVVMAFDDAVDLRAILLRIARFFADESCGQCVPCRVGTVRQEEVLQRLASGRPQGSVAEELGLLSDLGAVMGDASICGLGQTAASAVGSALSRLDPFNADGRTT